MISSRDHPATSGLAPSACRAGRPPSMIIRRAPGPHGLRPRAGCGCGCVERRVRRAVDPARMRFLRRPPDQLLELASRMSVHASSHGGVISAGDARALGAQDGDIRALIAARLWTRLRRGVYGDVAFVGTSGDHRHLENAAALLAACGADTVVSHVSGARILGLPTPYGDVGDEVELTRRPPRATATRPQVLGFMCRTTTTRTWFSSTEYRSWAVPASRSTARRHCSRRTVSPSLMHCCDGRW